MAPVANYLRMWDFSTAARVDRFIANSDNVRGRIWKTYRRESDVVHPPVNVESFYWQPSQGYYLAVSELVAYKRIDLAVRAFSQNGRQLKVVGDGPEYRRLRAMAAPNVEFAGRVSDAALRELLARSRAFVMPGEEDFGMTPVEALASGKPVVALGRGGALETVPSNGGVFFQDPSEAALTAAVERLEAMEAGLDPVAMQAWAAQFSETEFVRKMTPILQGQPAAQVLDVSAARVRALRP
jgi:glycosyltransferase involved in cell wall biosynthesis